MAWVSILNRRCDTVNERDDRCAPCIVGHHVTKDANFIRPLFPEKALDPVVWYGLYHASGGLKP
mgnify:CR=1 FL=1